MAEERKVVTPTGAERVLSAEDIKKAKEAAEKIRAEKKARFARILERGYLVDRLTANLPPELHGEWVPQDQVDRWLAMGFVNGAEFVDKRALHGAADGFAHIGDVVFVVLPKEDKEIMEEVRQEMYIATHGSPAQKAAQKQKEEKDFESRVHGDLREIGVVEEGSAKAARREELREAVEAGAAVVPGLLTKK